MLSRIISTRVGSNYRIKEKENTNLGHGEIVSLCPAQMLPRDLREWLSDLGIYFLVLIIGC